MWPLTLVNPIIQVGPIILATILNLTQILTSSQVGHKSVQHQNTSILIEIHTEEVDMCKSCCCFVRAGLLKTQCLSYNGTEFVDDRNVMVTVTLLIYINIHVAFLSMEKLWKFQLTNCTFLLVSFETYNMYDCRLQIISV